jgi:hypothetical protein
VAGARGAACCAYRLHPARIHCAHGAALTRAAAQAGGKKAKGGSGGGSARSAAKAKKAAKPAPAAAPEEEEEAEEEAEDPRDEDSMFRCTDCCGMGGWTPREYPGQPCCRCGDRGTAPAERKRA